MQRQRKHEPVILDRRRLLGTLGAVGLGLTAAVGGKTSTARAQVKDKKPTVPLAPPPADPNALSMEVAALRTFYLLKAAPDQAPDLPDRAQWTAVFNSAWNGKKPAAQPYRKRKEAKVSKDYQKVLSELHVAFVTNNEPRIHELSDQLEQLIGDEEPELDDKVEVTEVARQNIPTLLPYFDANRVVLYLSAYGKEFPDPYSFVMKNIGGYTGPKSAWKKPAEEDWPGVRTFLVQEVSWQVGGLDPDKQRKIGDQLGEFLDVAYKLSPEEIRKGGMGGGKLKRPLALIVGITAAEVISHVLERDLAELISNPRMIKAHDARRQYLSTISN